MKRYLMAFLGALVVGVVVSCGFFWATAEKAPRQSLRGRWLTEQYFVRDQMTPDDVVAAGSRDFKTIIDLRPDGETPGQPPSSEMAKASLREGMAFHYVPVPHGPIPEEAVTKLGEILSRTEGPVVLYCRSGTRAARTWALAEASRPGGADAGTIMRHVADAGFSAEDLKDDIAARIAARPEKAK